MDITDINTIFGPFPAARAGGDASALALAMQTAGTDYSLALSSRGIFYRDTDGNADTLVAVGAQGGLIPAATLNPLHFWGGPDSVDNLAAQGFELCRFFPGTQGWPVDYAPFAELVRLLAQSPLPLMVEIARPGDITLLERTAGDFPRPVILEGVTERTLAEALLVLKRRPQFMLETHSLPPALPFIVEQIGAERLLFGSGAPGLSLGAALRAVRQSALPASDVDAVLGGNAGRIWAGGELTDGCLRCPRLSHADAVLVRHVFCRRRAPEHDAARN